MHVSGLNYVPQSFVCHCQDSLNRVMLKLFSQFMASYLNNRVPARGFPRVLRTLSQGKLPLDLQAAACADMLGLDV